MKFVEYLFCDFKVNYDRLSKLICFTYRFGNYNLTNEVNFFWHMGYKVLRFFTKAIAKNYIPETCQIGPKLRLEHGGNGVFINSRAVIGENVRIFQQVTIGFANNENEVPIIRDNVLLGAGSRILGKIEIGDNAIVGANAVVITSVPPNTTAVGVPARLIMN